MHSGGSPEALRILKQTNDYDIFDADEFRFGSYYWRASVRAAPHNLYTSSTNWQKLAADTKDRDWRGWQFDKDVSATGTAVGKISFRYSPYYEVGWEYDKESGLYKRLANDSPFVDEDGEQTTATNVVIQYVSATVLDEEGRREMTTYGTGEARVLTGGNMTRGEWKKDKTTSRTIFYDDNNKEIIFKPGKIWVQVVPPGTALEIAN
jgi:hypothetical protein